MGTRFHALLDEALSEITRREPSYLSRFPANLARARRLMADYSGCALIERFPAAEVERALEQGIVHMRGQAPIEPDGAGASDAIGRILAGSIVDAHAAEQGALELLPGRTDDRPFAEVLRQDYDEAQSPAGIRYLVRRTGNRPLLLINACGIPLGVWSKFLGDADHDFRIIAVECRGQNIPAGGIRHESDLAGDAADIMSVLDHADAGPADVLAWCDGGRVAIELARSRPAAIRSLVFLSVSLRGTEALAQAATPHESNFEKVIAALAQRPALAPAFAKMLGQQLLGIDWEGFSDDPEGRADALLRLPAQAHEAFIRVPLSDDVFLLNHGKRARSDVSYPVDAAIRALGDRPVMMIAGDRDHIANNAVARAALAASVRNGVFAQIEGAGHYSFDLQYPYFRLALTEFLARGRPPPQTARLKVEAL